MPEVGDIKRGKEIGYDKNRSGRGCLYQWVICEKCGTGRWAQIHKHMPRFCHRCNCSLIGRDNFKGKPQLSTGYVFVYKPDHPFCNKYGYVFLHRIIMEDHIGRLLMPNEIVHHVNGIRTDNRLGNLRLCPSQRDHMIAHVQAGGEFTKTLFTAGHQPHKHSKSDAKLAEEDRKWRESQKKGG